MNKTIKIIDLLNMINKGEEVPKKVIFQNREYIRDNDDDFIYMDKDYMKIHLFNDLDYIVKMLDDEVEIIEESEQDIDIQAIEELEIIEEGNKAKLKTDTGNYPVGMRELEIIYKINVILRSNKESR